MQRLFTLFTFVALAGLCAVLYLPALQGPFLLDDAYNIGKAVPADGSVSALLSVAGDNQSGILGRPVSALYFGLVHHFLGSEPIYFKSVNLALHLLNGVLLYTLLSSICQYISKSGNHEYSAAFPVVVTGLWMLHPLQISTVMYAVQAMTLLSTFFTLAALIVYFKWRTMRTDRIAGAALLLACLACSALAVFSKENGALVLAYGFALECLVYSTKPSRNRLFALILAPLIALALFAAAILFAAGFFERLLSGYEYRDFTMAERLMSQPAVVLSYLKATLIPNAEQMGLYHDAWPTTERLSMEFWFPAGILLALLISGLLLAKTLPLYALGIALFFCSQLIESTFIPLELKFEHRMYLGSFGILLSALTLIQTITRSWADRFLFIALSCVLTATIGLQTLKRNQIWSDELVLNSSEAQRSPTSVRARTALAASYLKQNNIDEALAQLDAVRSAQSADSFLAIYELLLTGLAGLSVDSAFERALQAAEHAPISPNTLYSYVDIVTNKQRGYMAQLGDQQVEELGSVILGNPLKQVRNTDLVPFMGVVSDVMIRNKHLMASADLLKQAIALSDGNFPMHKRVLRIYNHLGRQDLIASNLADYQNRHGAHRPAEVAELREFLSEADL